jgi:Fe-S-cluster containining protein
MSASPADPALPAISAIPAAVIDWVERLHEVVDELAVPIAKAHGARLHCRSGCTACCTDGLSVFAVEAAVIARHHGELLAEGEPHPEGACAFLDDHGACRVYAQRPYVCRTQGLPLRWLEQDEEGAKGEARDICPLNLEGPALEELGADECWTLGPFEERLGARQSTIDGGKGERIALRSLFAGGRRRLPIAK